MLVEDDSVPHLWKAKSEHVRERMTTTVVKGLKVMSWQMWGENYRCYARENMKTFFKHMHACHVDKEKDLRVPVQEAKTRTS